jgi:hypothetical protein
VTAVDTPLTSEDLPPEFSVRTDEIDAIPEPVAVEAESSVGRDAAESGFPDRGADLVETDLQVGSQEPDHLGAGEPEESEPEADREL